MIRASGFGPIGAQIDVRRAQPKAGPAKSRPNASAPVMKKADRSRTGPIATNVNVLPERSMKPARV